MIAKKKKHFRQKKERYKQKRTVRQAGLVGVFLTTKGSCKERRGED